MQNAAFIEVQAEVRYWEDASVDGQEDTDGTLIPCRKGDLWAPVISLSDGQIIDWPEGKEADIHYKVCDGGEYWLLDESKTRIAYKEGYVPNSILCVGDNGYGDYIIFKVDPDGKVIGWKNPSIDDDDWTTC